MSSIDAAIIKALVEHIGMNPDEVPTGGSSTDTIIPVTWSTQNVDGYDMLAFSLPEGSEIKIGTCLKLTYIYNGNNREWYLYCVQRLSDGYRFRTSGKVFPFTKTGNLYVADEIAVGMNIQAIPDNSTTGLFKISNNEMMNQAFETIFLAISSMT